MVDKALFIVFFLCLLGLLVSTPRPAEDCDDDEHINLLQSWTKVTVMSDQDHESSNAPTRGVRRSTAGQRESHSRSAKHEHGGKEVVVDTGLANGSTSLAGVATVQGGGDKRSSGTVHHVESRIQSVAPLESQRKLTSDEKRELLVTAERIEQKTKRKLTSDEKRELFVTAERIEQKSQRARAGLTEQAHYSNWLPLHYSNAHLTEAKNFSIFDDELDASEVTGVGKNSQRDFQTLKTSLVIYGSMVLLASIAFQFFKDWYPLVYCYNDLNSTSESYTAEDTRINISNEIPSHFCSLKHHGWVWASYQFWWKLEDDDLIEHIGLDMVMLLRFLQFCIMLLTWIGVPFILILCPINDSFGSVAETGDILTRTGMNNIAEGSSLLWYHAIGVWYVVWITHQLLEKYQARFLKIRLKWLRSMPEPRATTIMLQNVPELSSPDGEEKPEDVLQRLINDKVFNFITQKHGDKVVEKVTFVKPAMHLKDLTRQLSDTKEELNDLECEMEQRRKDLMGEGATPRDADDTDPPELMQLGEKIDATKEHFDTLEKQIEKEKELVNSKERSGTAFVTFTERQYAELFLNMRLKASDFEFIQSTPPDPNDVDWNAALAEQTMFGGAGATTTWTMKFPGLADVGPFTRSVAGYTLILLLFVVFVPIVASISAMTKLSYVREKIPAVDRLMYYHPEWANVWDAVFASVGLTFFMSLLPTCLMVIQRAFFPSVADRESQLGLHRWYFNFMLIFVVLVTAVTGSIVSTAEQIIQHPLSVFDILAARLPQSSHFYLNWFVLQWFTYVLNLLRYMNLIKYNSAMGGLSLFMSGTDRSRRAKYLSEPENTDCYGIGARSAETVLLLAVALVFCSLVPVICVFGAFTFAVVRMIYGYLLIYAETRKPDLGGIFWAEQLNQVNSVLFIYIILMTGVFTIRSSDLYLILFVLFALPYHSYRYYKFRSVYRFDVVPLLNQNNSVDFDVKPKDPLPNDIYVQPELRDRVTLGAKSDPSGSEKAASRSSRNSNDTAQASESGEWQGYEAAEPGLGWPFVERS